MPIYRRMEKLKALLQSYVRTNKKQMIEGVEKFFDERIETALFERSKAAKCLPSAASLSSCLLTTSPAYCIKTLRILYSVEISAKKILLKYFQRCGSPSLKNGCTRHLILHTASSQRAILSIVWFKLKYWVHNGKKLQKNMLQKSITMSAISRSLELFFSTP